MDIKITEYSINYKSTVKEFIISILEGEFGHYNVERPDLDSIEEYYQMDNGNFWIALVDGELIGTIGLKNYGEYGYLQRMAVKKDFRGKGIAQKLLATLLEYAQTNKYTAIYLATSPNLVAANKFYIKEGFIKVEKLPEVIPIPIAPIYFMKNLIT